MAHDLYISIVCSLIGTMIYSVDAQEPAILKDILPEVKPINATGTLDCTVTNVGESNIISWSKEEVTGQPYNLIISKGTEIQIADNDNRGEDEDSGQPKYSVYKFTSGKQITYRLTVRYLLEEDSGYYICSIQTQGVADSQWPKKRGYILVQVAPVIRNTNDIFYELKAGDNVSLKCEAQGKPAPNITWKREDGQVMRNQHFNYRGNTMVIFNIRKEDRGNYICVADNSVRPPAIMVVSVNVFYKPACRSVVNTVGQAQNRGYYARLECVVQGYPTPQTYWEKNETGHGWSPVNDGDKYKINRQEFEDNVRYILTIRNVQANDFATYRCFGNNSYGTNYAEFQLFETSECQGAICLKLGPPEPPINFRVSEITSDSITVSWVGDFNGNFPQTFVILIIDTSTNQSFRLEVKENSTNVYTHKEDGLNPFTKYQLHIYSYNVAGNSTDPHFIALEVSTKETIKCQGANCPGTGAGNALCASYVTIFSIIMSMAILKFIKI